MWMSGKIPAQDTANNVMASAKRLMEVRHCCRSSRRIAEISVPAWPIPIHQTKLMIAKPHPIGALNSPNPHADREEIGDGVQEQHHQRERSGEAQNPPLRRAAHQDNRADLVRDRRVVVSGAKDRPGQASAPLVCQPGYPPCFIPL